ncbi:glutathione S-transferase family protein [Congregibacter sp.]|uniref:glutathione S-transferase family protein n=1 Tax=Congregibacter sp. TaxID=2744308 RepID=UPI0038582728
MSDLILHQYADSPFSEKVRAILGYAALPYRSVDIPAIMPKPDLIALTGGYRRTPVMQLGADIYCDTALIAEIIDTHSAQSELFSGSGLAQTIAAARWTDSEFFRVCVGLVFQPAAIAANPRFQDPGAAEAFVKDRAAFTSGSPGLAVPLSRAEAVFKEHMRAMERSLAGMPYLGGDTPSILDFSTWHLCWFVHRQEVLRHYFEGYPAVDAWLEKMTAFSDGKLVTTISSDEAITIARDTEPAPIEHASVDPLLDAGAGARVQVLPTDYGFQAVVGSLVAADDKHIVIAREDDRAGRVNVHFPRYGFEVSLAGDEA